MAQLPPSPQKLAPALSPRGSRPVKFGLNTVSIDQSSGRQSVDTPDETTIAAVDFTRTTSMRMMHAPSLPCMTHPCGWHGKKPVWILFHEAMEPLARSVVTACDVWLSKVPIDRLEHLEQLRTRSIELKGVVHWNTFRDGFPNLFIEKVRDMAGKDIIFIASFHNVGVIFEQMSIIYALPRYMAHSVTIILPYFPTGTMERVDLEGQVATANTLAKLFSVTPMTARGPVQLMIFDIHALQERFYFGAEIIPRLVTALPMLVRELERSMTDEIDRGTLSIAFPDEGAKKRFTSMFPDEWPVIFCSKSRDGDKRVISIKDGEVEGRDIVIADDLAQTGGTLKECCRLMRAKGALSVRCFVTHAVFPGESWRAFTEPGMVDTFWITDSVPHANEIVKHAPFKMLSLGPVIADELLGFDLKYWD